MYVMELQKSIAICNQPADILAAIYRVRFHLYSVEDEIVMSYLEQAATFEAKQNSSKTTIL